MSPVDGKERISLKELGLLVDQALHELGLQASDREAVADVLLYAELRGSSQGLVKILERTVLPAANASALTIEHRSSCIVHIQANGNPGMVVLRKAADEVIERAADYGMALAMTCGTATSTGSIGYYARRIAQAGLIGVVMAGSPKVMALQGSLLPAMGTNPMAFALPTLDKPLVFDMATSAITWFDIIKAARAGVDLPENVALDHQGLPTIDAAAALQGMLLTAGGAKGSGLALMVECLTGPLSGASIVGDQTDSRGNFVLAIDPDTVLGDDSFKRTTSTMLSRMRAGSTRDGAALRLPGDRSDALAAKRIAQGSIDLDSDLLSSLRTLQPSS